MLHDLLLVSTPMGFAWHGKAERYVRKKIDKERQVMVAADFRRALGFVKDDGSYYRATTPSGSVVSHQYLSAEWKRVRDIYREIVRDARSILQWQQLPGIPRRVQHASFVDAEKT